MNGLNSADAAQALIQFAEAAAAREAELEQFESDGARTETDEECDSPSPIFDSFFNEGGSAGIAQLCNFSADEFHSIYDIIQSGLSSAWTARRGRTSSILPKDAFLMLLTTLKHAGNWDFLAAMFRMKGPTFERTVIVVLENVIDVLYETVVDRWEKKYSMAKLAETDRMFPNYKCARYATDVTFQQSYRPSGSHQESKAYFSNKHKLYGFKTEMSVLPNGLAINCSSHHNGSKSDISIFRSNQSFHTDALRKQHDEGSMQDFGPLSDEHSSSWAVLMDKGYQGSADFCRAIIPKKKPINGVLAIEDMRTNSKISSDRVIVENYFGRMCSLWMVMGSKYRWNEHKYDSFLRVCTALTNIHIKWHPLRDEDGVLYNRYKNRLYAIGDEIVTKRKRSQASYRARRRARLARNERSPEDGAGAMLDMLDD